MSQTDKVVKWIVAWKIYIFLTLQRMQSELQAFLLPASFKIVALEVEVWTSFETNFFRKAGILEAKTSLMEKLIVYLL